MQNKNIEQLNQNIILMQEQQQKAQSSHRDKIVLIALDLLKKSKLSSNSQTLILTTRSEEVLTSILHQSQIYSCGFTKIIKAQNLINNSFLSYNGVVVAISLSGVSENGEQSGCYHQLSMFSHRLENVHIMNLNISSSNSKKKIRMIQFKNESLKGYMEENLDFICYLKNVFLLSSRGEKNKNLSSQAAINRMCSVLFSQPKFHQFEFYVPKKTKDKLLHEKLEATVAEKLAIFEKYGYKGYTDKGGVYKTKVIILERTENLSPFIYSLYYGSMIEELKIGNKTKLISNHSQIYNKLYSEDIGSACEQLSEMSKAVKEGLKHEISTDNFAETKKILMTAYNPNMTKQEIMLHQDAMKQITSFSQKKTSLIDLQQSIANGVNKYGQRMKGSKIVEDVYAWCSQNEENKIYHDYRTLAMMGLITHNFWWFQKNKLLSLIEENEKPLMETLARRSKSNLHHLTEVNPEKDENGEEVRTDYFRHLPNIVRELQNLELQSTHNILSINKIHSSKKSKTFVFINSPLGYNQLVMILRLKLDYEIICLSLMTSLEWAESQLAAFEEGGKKN